MSEPKVLLELPSTREGHINLRVVEGYRGNHVVEFQYPSGSGWASAVPVATSSVAAALLRLASERDTALEEAERQQDNAENLRLERDEKAADAHNYEVAYELASANRDTILGQLAELKAQLEEARREASQRMTPADVAELRAELSGYWKELSTANRRADRWRKTYQDLVDRLVNSEATCATD